MGVLATLITTIVSGEASEAIGRARRAAIVYLIAGLLAWCGIGFFLGAGFVALARELGPITAALWFGGGFIALATLLLVVHRISARLRARRVARRRSTEAKAVASTAALGLLPALLAGGKGRAAAILGPALLAGLGYVAYREFRRREDERDD